MKNFVACVLAAACASALAAPQAADTYRAAMNKAANDYKVSKAKCDSTTGHAKDLCVQQAQVERAQAESAAADKYPNSDRKRERAKVSVADAEYKLARTRCADQSGNAKDSCLSEARSTHASAVNEARGSHSTARTAQTSKSSKRSKDTTSGSTATADTSTTGSTATTADTSNTATTTNPANTATTGNTSTTGTTPTTATTSPTTMDNTTGTTAGTTAGTMDQRSANTAGTNPPNTRDTGSVTDRARDATQRSGDTVADSMITTRVKADMISEPNLKSSDIHVETVDGVVMLSGFVNNKTEADRAIEVARSVKGVQDVKSSLKVK